MEPINPDIQRRVWQRVYPQSRKPQLSRQQQEALRRSLSRTKENLAVYESLRSHPVYADAFQRLAVETEEHRKMLRQILEQR